MILPGLMSSTYPVLDVQFEPKKWMLNDGTNWWKWRPSHKQDALILLTLTYTLSTHYFLTEKQVFRAPNGGSRRLSNLRVTTHT